MVCKHNVKYRRYDYVYPKGMIGGGDPEVIQFEFDKFGSMQLKNSPELVPCDRTWYELNDEEKIEADKKQLAYGITCSCEDNKQ